MQNAFDIDLAIAALEPQAYMPAPFPVLRDKYPELRFVFDELEDLREVALSAVSADDFEALEDENEELEKQLTATRVALDRVRSLLADIDEKANFARDELEDVAA